MCAEWVRDKSARAAYGIDLDQQTLDWGRTHNLTTLTDEEIAESSSASRMYVTQSKRRRTSPVHLISLTACLKNASNYWTTSVRQKPD
ncbi:MAG: hypothetical protein CM1200mP25_4360 [Acidobacteriota bacterium]|nr:MAG: hypothetical protein CM1200mP25_4360 [Acidobacteriota bacterium]